MGDPRSRRVLPKLSGHPKRGRQVCEASATTKTLDPHRVQSKEKSLLWSFHGHQNWWLREKCTMSKLWVKFDSGTLLRTIAQETASQILLRNWSKEIREEEPGYVSFSCWKKTYTNIKRLLLITKNTHSKLKFLMFFFGLEDIRTWVHWNYSLDVHLKDLDPSESTECFLNFLQAALSVGDCTG